MSEHPQGGALAGAEKNDSAIPKRCPQCAARYPADFRVCPRDATPLEDAPAGEDALVGTVLCDSYEILRVIGEGGMGRVYEAAHRRLRNKRFAIKVLHAHLARQPEVVTRFQREAEAASVLSHPNVVDVFDVNRTPDGRPFIVGELLEGEDLGRYLERVGRMPLVPAIRIVRQVCRALSAAHARGIVHRDVKPENVFLVGASDAPFVKVLDFGISKLGDGTGTLTKTGVIMGTPAYMPPEQARGGHVDHRADVYAVGAILYRAVTGAKPFDDREPVATLTAVMGEEPPRPSTLERSIPPALELVIQKAMAKHPAERYPSLAALEAELAVFDPDGPDEPVASAGAAAPSGSAGPVGTAHTLLSSSAMRATVSQVGDGHKARGARSQLVLFTVFGIGWLLAGLCDAAVHGVRWVRGTDVLTDSEITLAAAGAIAALMTPAALWTRHLSRQVWPSTPRAVETAERLRTTLTVSLVAYALATVFGHGLAAFAQRDPRGAAWPGWPVLAFAAAWLAAALVWFWSARRKHA